MRPQAISTSQQAGIIPQSRPPPSETWTPATRRNLGTSTARDVADDLVGEGAPAVQQVGAPDALAPRGDAVAADDEGPPRPPRHRLRQLLVRHPDRQAAPRVAPPDRREVQAVPHLPHVEELLAAGWGRRRRLRLGIGGLGVSLRVREAGAGSLAVGKVDIGAFAVVVFIAGDGGEPKSIARPQWYRDIWFVAVLCSGL
ncbi:hypothetical protein DL766_005352 [Monosporascus sp. MC13-8B]|uniref:Uncharacterized protein n=1 Tax=Monosporascus cannonballus TaxID=155416 RepID=A0ABY0HDG2_9PEZI|nr:hypothetical protein DL762_003985 [Monosporascus cannonballus]RYO95120.1 hypothetical protein DL763_003818 [Monosporascus cannonballus]RYP29484.1 hypothetical protein DL766_005352 [Monosporascus sp. MC13-8B]